MTRKDRSKLLVAVTGILVFSAAGVFAGVKRGPAPPGGEDSAGTPPPPDTVVEGEEGARVARGRQLFREVGCTGCHSAEWEGSRRLPLDGVGSRLSADTLRLWIVDPRSVDPGVRKPAYDDLPSDEVEALVAYMRSLEEDPGG